MTRIGDQHNSIPVSKTDQCSRYYATHILALLFSSAALPRWGALFPGVLRPKCRRVSRTHAPERFEGANPQSDLPMISKSHQRQAWTINLRKNKDIIGIPVRLVGMDVGPSAAHMVATPAGTGCAAGFRRSRRCNRFPALRSPRRGRDPSGRQQDVDAHDTQQRRRRRNTGTQSCRGHYRCATL